MMTKGIIVSMTLCLLPSQKWMTAFDFDRPHGIFPAVNYTVCVYLYANAFLMNCLAPAESCVYCIWCSVEHANFQNMCDICSLQNKDNILIDVCTFFFIFTYKNRSLDFSEKLKTSENIRNLEFCWQKNTYIEILVATW